jgi:type VI secretion system protein ImpJ
MEIQRPLFWHQGLFLQPQHFQLLDRSYQSLLVPFYQFLEPYFWGISGIEIQKAGLGTRTFTLSNGSFLFLDGAYAALHENALVESRSFDEAWIEGGKPFPVYVGLKKWNPMG